MIHSYYEQHTVIRFDINLHLFYESPIFSCFDTKIVLALWVEIRSEHVTHVDSFGSRRRPFAEGRILRKMDVEGTEFNLWRHLSLYFPIVGDGSG